MKHPYNELIANLTYNEVVYKVTEMYNISVTEGKEGKESFETRWGLAHVEINQEGVITILFDNMDRFNTSSLSSALNAIHRIFAPRAFFGVVEYGEDTMAAGSIIPAKFVAGEFYRVFHAVAHRATAWEIPIGGLMLRIQFEDGWYNLKLKKNDEVIMENNISKTSVVLNVIECLVELTQAFEQE